MLEGVTVSVNEDIVSVVGPIIFKNHKLNNIEKFDAIEEDVKKERWEAVMLINKCIKHTMHYEKVLKKEKDAMTEDEQLLVKDEFYKKYLYKLGEEKRNRLINLIDTMILKKELDKNLEGN